MKRLLLVLALLLAPVALEAQATPDTVYVVYQPQRSPGSAGLFSALIIGSGQAYNGEWGKGVGFLTGAVLFFVVAGNGSADCDARDECTVSQLGIAGLVATWGLGIIDAVRSAKRLNAAVVQVAPTTGTDGRVGFSVSIPTR